MTSALSGQGTVFKRAGATVSEVRALNGLNLQRDTLDATNFGSNGFDEFILGLKKSGQLTVEVNWIPADATHLGFKSDYDNGTTQAFAIVYPFSPTQTLTFNGIVMEWSPNTQVNGIMTLTVIIKITGTVTLSSP